jgi:hypothetical protein
MRGELQLISPDLEPVGGHDMLVVAVWGLQDGVLAPEHVVVLTSREILGTLAPHL